FQAIFVCFVTIKKINDTFAFKWFHNILFIP
ncbi:MAG: hypothetical protein ACI83H_000154, partial [Glaciecola sp.]